MLIFSRPSLTYPLYLYLYLSLSPSLSLSDSHCFQSLSRTTGRERRRKRKITSLRWRTLVILWSPGSAEEVKLDPLLSLSLPPLSLSLPPDKTALVHNHPPINQSSWDLDLDHVMLERVHICKQRSDQKKPWDGPPGSQPGYPPSISLTVLSPRIVHDTRDSINKSIFSTSPNSFLPWTVTVGHVTILPFFSHSNTQLWYTPHWTSWSVPWSSCTTHCPFYPSQW